MRAGLVVLAIIAVAAVVAALNALFIINPMQQALVLQFGQVKNTIREPGLNVKVPFIQDVLIIDKRILDLNVPAQEIIAADQKRLVVDAFMRYRIRNPVEFYQTVNNVAEGAQRLNTFVQASLRAVLADATFEDIVRDERPQLMQRIKEDVAQRAQSIGVEIVDVKIRRADLPEANSAAIFRRMQTEREQEAREIRARGAEAARRIEAAADRTSTVLRAEARRQSEQIRGEGDARKNAIFAAAYTLDPNFFAFYRAMQAYEQGLRSQDTRLVLSPEADFFRYFNDPMGASSRAGVIGSGPSVVPSEDSAEAEPAETTAALPEPSGADPSAVREQIEELGGDLTVVEPPVTDPVDILGTDILDPTATPDLGGTAADPEASAAETEATDPVSAEEVDEAAREAADEAAAAEAGESTALGEPAPEEASQSATDTSSEGTGADVAPTDAGTDDTQSSTDDTNINTAPADDATTQE